MDICWEFSLELPHQKLDSCDMIENLQRLFLCRCRWTYVAKLKKKYPGTIESGTYNYNLYNCSLCTVYV